MENFVANSTRHLRKWRNKLLLIKSTAQISKTRNFLAYCSKWEAFCHSILRKYLIRTNFGVYKFGGCPENPPKFMHTIFRSVSLTAKITSRQNYYFCNRQNKFPQNFFSLNCQNGFLHKIGLLILFHRNCGNSWRVYLMSCSIRTPFHQSTIWP